MNLLNIFWTTKWIIYLARTQSHDWQKMDNSHVFDEKIDNIRDRLARAEQDIKNNKENFNSFKLEDFNSLKSEVLTMRKELNEKIDSLIEKVSTINITMAKWVGGFSVLMFIGEIIAKKFI